MAKKTKEFVKRKYNTSRVHGHDSQSSGGRFDGS